MPILSPDIDRTKTFHLTELLICLLRNIKVFLKLIIFVRKVQLIVEHKISFVFRTSWYVFILIVLNLVMIVTTILWLCNCFYLCLTCLSTWYAVVLINWYGTVSNILVPQYIVLRHWIFERLMQIQWTLICVNSIQILNRYLIIMLTLKP